MRLSGFVALSAAVLSAACGSGADGGRAGESTPANAGGGATRPTASGLVEGKDYLVLERHRILDEMGFDQPVEAMSVLVPKGWRTQSGVKWRGVGECRGDIITWEMTATSPDGAIKFVVLPTRTFVASQNQMTRQALMAAQQQGGCTVNQPFTATEYLQGLAQRDLGATVSDIREDARLRGLIEKMNAQSNAISRQYGNQQRQSGTAAYGTLSWSDGTKGLVNAGVSVIETPGVDLYGAPNGFATTSVFYQVYIRYPADREAEALKHFGTITSSHRMNPVWTQAKERFLTQLGNVEHAGRMERLRLQGEQAAAYAKSQSEASDAQMRNWERKQASSDASQASFIQTIREVETWKDASGSPVELNAGYNFGWSRPDGAIILTNTSTFDPAVELKQNWVKMEKAQR